MAPAPAGGDDAVALYESSGGSWVLPWAILPKVMAAAERLDARAIATFDRRHFDAVEFERAIEIVP